MDAWECLRRELDCWANAGRVATLWWRDDDAEDITPQLNELMAISADVNVPIMLAVIPAALSPEFKAQTFSSNVRLAQHGYTHTNFANPGAKKSEFSPKRKQTDMVADINTGFREIMALANGISAFVPPWNRMDMTLLPSIQKAGITAISTFTPRKHSEPVTGLRQVNTHADVMDWRGSRGFAGEHSVLVQITEHLSARRTGTVDSDEPTGLLTHHLVHDAACWRFLEMFTQKTIDHPAATWLPIDIAMVA